MSGIVKSRQYVVMESGNPISNVIDEVNDHIYSCYGFDFESRFFDDATVVAAPLADYVSLLRELKAIPHIKFVTHHDLCTFGPDPGAVTCAIRHDVDADFRTACAMSDIEASQGVRSSYYFVHTGPYWGEFRDGVFRRNGCIATRMREIQAAGHEVGLHTDPYLIYHDHGIDGAQALVAELAWMRSEGLTVTGTCAHNSASVYGAFNYEIFRGRGGLGPSQLWQGGRRQPSSDKATVTHGGKTIPLQVLDEAELGLVYEANDAFTQFETNIYYGATWGLDTWYFHNGPGIKSDVVFVGQREMLKVVGAARPGDIILLVVHPLYYGCRHNRVAGPALQVDSESETQNSPLGWTAREPGTLCARSGVNGGEIEFQAFNRVNSLGMLDLPPESAVEALFLGGPNFDGSAVGLEAQVHRLTAKAMGKALGRPWRTAKLAHRRMGVARYAHWLEQGLERFRPSQVVLGVGYADLLLMSPHWWGRISGFAPAAPPHGYWAADDKGGLRRVESDPAWRTRLRPPEGLDTLRQAILDLARSGSPLPADALALLSACVSALARRCVDAGATPIVMIESSAEWGGADPVFAADLAGGLATAIGQGNPGLSLVNPYDHGLDPAMIWRSAGEWSYVGHRRAADALTAVLSDGAKASADEAWR